MMVYEIEMREAAQDKAFELLDELHELGHQKKMVMCELEDTLYDCFEGSEEELEDKTEEGMDLGFKAGYNRHYAMRNFEDDKMDMRNAMRANRRRAMRMRRARRYA